MIKKWMIAIRPKTLFAAAAPVLVGWGIAIKAGSFPIDKAIAALLCALLLQIAANLANDVSDFQKGADTEERLGPQRVTQSKLMSEKQVWIGTLVVLLLAGFVGLYLAFTSGWGVILIGALSIAAALLYTVGPFSFSDIGLGELFVLIFFGFVAVCGTIYVLIGYVPLEAWLGGLSVGALTVNILVVNNVRDIDADRKAGRRNIPVLYGQSGGAWQYASMLVIAFSTVLLLPFLSHSFWVLLPLILIPSAISLFRKISQTAPGKIFNQYLAETARLVFLYGLLLGIGLAI
ncbi:MAG: 1,4-dihydroxy-2-naphthoate polyprenyltransferase [Anaerolineaceae bacterium]|nr:1,4-dihydroxy-2-naphthoate polyprenyltransferase [Anaerolineaceae bacterium]